MRDKTLIAGGTRPLPPLWINREYQRVSWRSIMRAPLYRLVTDPHFATTGGDPGQRHGGAAVPAERAGHAQGVAACGQPHAAVLPARHDRAQRHPPCAGGACASAPLISAAKGVIILSCSRFAASVHSGWHQGQMPFACVHQCSVMPAVQVCSGDETAGRVQSWIERHYEGDLHLEVSLFCSACVSRAQSVTTPTAKMV